MLLFATAAFTAGCATRSSTTGTYLPAGGPLPTPRRVLVMDFAVDPAHVGLDQGIGPRLERQFSSGSSGGSQYGTAVQVQSAISETLVSEIRKMGLPADRAAPGTVPGPGDAIVQGQVERISEGNRTRRLAIGFGAGKSEVDASAALYLANGQGSVRLLQSYDADSNSGRKPGMGVGAASAAGGSLAPAAISGATGVYGETKRTGVAEEGQRLAERLSYNLGTLFAKEGWIAQSAVPTSFVR
jgi:hypothetical protein